MLSRCARVVWRPKWLAAALAVVGMNSLAVREAPGQNEVQIDRVEEDWEMVVGNPDAALDAPQITCTYSPTGNLDGIHAAIELNHRSQPSFAQGGLQIQVWNGESLVVARSYVNNAPLSTDGETVRWTQTLDLHGGNLIFEVINGTSTTWGAFGGQGYLKATIHGVSLTNLNGYHPDVSVANSGVGYASNRVQSLVLKEVRLITSTGDVLTDSTPRVVHQE